jgi:signal transduction histidine kinase
MDIAIDYYSPAVFAGIVTAFLSLFVLARDFRLRFNNYFGVLGLAASVWFFLFYFLSETQNSAFVPYVLAFAGVILSFSLLSSIQLVKHVFASKKRIPGKFYAFLVGTLWLGTCLMTLAIYLKSAFLAKYDLAVDNLAVILIVLTLGLILALSVVVIEQYYLSYKVFVAQLVATLVMLLNLAGLLNSSGVEETVLRFVLIIILLFLSHYLVQSVVGQIQKRKKIQETTEEIAAANKRLKKLDRAKSDFIKGASHQLRSPLSVVKGITSLLLDESYGQLSASLKDALEKVYISNERLIGLIEDLLDISHLEEGRVEFEFRKIDLNAVAKKAVNGLTLQAKNKKLYLKFSPYKKSKLSAWIDDHKVTEAISNLIDNAIKYTRKGGVTVELTKSGNKAVVTVRDTGIGLKKEERQNLFQKFVRAGRGNKMSTVGTGLGLYVVRKMVEAHRGRIFAESPGEGKGSSFIIGLPLDLKNPPDMEYVKSVVMEKASD